MANPGIWYLHRKNRQEYICEGVQLARPLASKIGKVVHAASVLGTDSAHDYQHGMAHAMLQCMQCFSIRTVHPEAKLERSCEQYFRK